MPGANLEHFAAHAAHTALYAIMIILPLSGYLGTGGSSYLFGAIELPAFKDTSFFTSVIEGTFGISWDAFESVADFAHKSGGKWVVSALVALHSGAALIHHYVRRDLLP